MKTQALCESLLHDACDANVAFYRTLIENEPLDAIKDSQWKRLVVLARTLPADQKEVLLGFARQAAIDAVSTMCGGIDGSSQLGGEFVSLSLIDEQGQQHAGALQETFLELVERARQ
jgi:hypothetical protein